MKTLWKSSGLHLVDRQDNGELAVTPDLLRAYFTRPEIHPMDESCDREHALFERLMRDPAAAVSEAEIAGIADADAAENYRLVLALRDHLLACRTLERAYSAIVAGKGPALPSVFLHQLLHLIVAGLLSQTRDAFEARAGEIFFREQKATTGDGRLFLADAEIVERLGRSGGMGALGSLLVQSGTPLRDVSLDVLTTENQAQYFARADRFDFALDFRFTQEGQDAFARVLERWVRHFLAVDTRIQALASISDERWSWHVGLDRRATSILNSLYRGEPVEDEEQHAILALFRMEFLDRGVLIDTMRGKPVYLALAMDPDGVVRMKPQNLLVNLPLKKAG